MMEHFVSRPIILHSRRPMVCFAMRCYGMLRYPHFQQTTSNSTSALCICRKITWHDHQQPTHDRKINRRMGERTHKQTNNQTLHQTLKPIKHTNKQTHTQPTEQSNAQERRKREQTNDQRCRAVVTPNLVRPNGHQPDQTQGTPTWAGSRSILPGRRHLHVT